MKSDTVHNCSAGGMVRLAGAVWCVSLWGGMLVTVGCTHGYERVRLAGALVDMVAE